MNSQRPLSVRIVRIIPTVLICSVAGCAIGYFGFHVALSYLPIAVIVPLTWAFILSRILKLAIPIKAQTEHRPHPPDGSGIEISNRAVVVALTIFLLLLAVGVYGAITFLFSAASFFLLSLQAISAGAARIAEFLGVVAVGSLLVISLIILAKFASMNSDKLTRWVWKILSFPQQLADFFPGFRHDHLTRH
jgi:hypothetical protein